MRDPVDILRATVLHLTEAVAVVLFVAMIAVWLALASGQVPG
jgi:hypothetical protein